MTCIGLRVKDTKREYKLMSAVLIEIDGLRCLLIPTLLTP